MITTTKTLLKTVNDCRDGIALLFGLFDGQTSTCLAAYISLSQLHLGCTFAPGDIPKVLPHMLVMAGEALDEDTLASLPAVAPLQMDVLTLAS